MYIVCKNDHRCKCECKRHWNIRSSSSSKGGLLTCTKTNKTQTKPEKFLRETYLILWVSVSLSSSFSCKIRDLFCFCIYYWMKLFSKSTVSSGSGVAACKYLYHKFKKQSLEITPPRATLTSSSSPSSPAQQSFTLKIKFHCFGFLSRRWRRCVLIGWRLWTD